MGFKEKYGSFALVAGASKGLGAAFADALAKRGMSLVLIARDISHLHSTAAELTGLYGTEVLTLGCDLAAPDATKKVRDFLNGRMINFLVYNAAESYIGPFLGKSVTDHMHIAEVNMLTPIRMLHHFGGMMVQQKRGAIVLMSSLAGNQGSGFLATYAASKAFNRILAESLWYEWKKYHVDVIGCSAGATLTPNYIQSNPGKVSVFAPKPQLPQEVVEECFSKVGKAPSFISGRSNKIACFFMNHIFSVKRSVSIMGAITKEMYRIPD